MSWTSPGPIEAGPSSDVDLDMLPLGESPGERPVVRRQRRGDGLHARPEARPEDLEVRAGLPATEHLGRFRHLDPLHVQLLGHRVQKPSNDPGASARCTTAAESG